MVWTLERDFQNPFKLNVAVLLPPPLLLLKGGDYDGVVVAHLHAPLVAGQGAEGDVRDRKVVPLQQRKSDVRSALSG